MWVIVTDKLVYQVTLSKIKWDGMPFLCLHTFEILWYCNIYIWYYNLLFWTSWYGNVRHYQLVSFDNFPIIARGQLIEQRDSSIKTMLVF